MTGSVPRAIPRPTLIARSWVEHRSFTPDRIPPIDFLLERRRVEGSRISVCLPAFNNEATIGRICKAITEDLMDETLLVDELLVVDGGSTDETVRCARDAGAQTVRAQELIPEVAHIPGKGDSMWRSLTLLTGDMVVWIDAGLNGFRSEVATRLIAPLLVDGTISFVKGYDDQADEIDVELDGHKYYAGGDRLTELLARPLLNILLPELGGFFQPLAAAYAGRSETLRRLPFLTGCSVDAATLIDAVHLVGLERVAQVDVGVRLEAALPLEELRLRAHAIATTILKRAEEQKRLKLAPNAQTHPLLVRRDDGVDQLRIDEVERPPVDVLPPYLAALRSGSQRHAAPASRRTPRTAIPVSTWPGGRRS